MRVVAKSVEYKSVSCYGVQRTWDSMKTLVGYEYVFFEIEEGLAWQQVNIKDTTIGIPLLKEDFISLFDVATKTITITNEIVMAGMARLDIMAKQAVQKRIDEEKAEKEKRDTESIEKILKHPINQLLSSTSKDGGWVYYVDSWVLQYKDNPLVSEKIALAIEEAGESTKKSFAATEKREEEKLAAQRILDEDKVKWIATHGSERLKLAVAEGYNAQKQYVIERAAVELGVGATVDYDDKGKWKDRSCPSLDALTLEKELKVKGFTSSTVWGYLCDCNEDCDCEKHEMVIISDFFGKDVIVVEF